MTTLFEQLICIGLGQKCGLSKIPSAEEWEQLHELCYEQGLLGIGYEGAAKVSASAEMAQQMPRAFMLRWYMEAEEIKALNAKFYHRCVKLEKRFEEDGCQISVLKGQALAAIYRTPDSDLRMLRQCGDIDLWMAGGREHCLQYLREHFAPFHFDYKHADPHIFKDVKVEVHWIPEICTNLLTHRRLMRLWAEEEQQLNEQLVALPNGYGEVHTLALPLNCFYVLLHCYRHFMLGGIGMKQVIDIYFVLKQLEPKHREVVVSLVSRFGMMRFASALMWILSEVFHIEPELLLCPPEKPEGSFVLKELYRYGHLEAQKEQRKQSKVRWRGWNYIQASFRHLSHICLHYPKESLWVPIWMAYHLGWKIWYKIANK